LLGVALQAVFALVCEQEAVPDIHRGSKTELRRIAMDFTRARLAMVESQIRPNGVRDPLILNAFATLERERFVPEPRRALAYMDEAIQVAPALDGAPPRYLLPPMTLARMLEFAAPAPSDHALDVGGGTGYSAAILAKLCGKVDALETPQAFADRVTQYLKEASAGGVSVHGGPLEKGLDALKPFNLILIAGGVSQEPRQLFDQLAEGGRLVTILRNGWQGHAYLYTKSFGAVSGRAIFDAGAEILPGFEPKPQFVF
jgi:protein-L-isoaspartate(D-aspartate) O-methyltransferase